ncbi:MAG: nucleoside kinase [Oscillospiraceae bacterium]|nr:nucleoside kinase [Oscillospiraceae bacterium]
MMNTNINYKTLMNIAEVNGLLARSESDFILRAENRYKEQISDICEYIKERGAGKIVLLAGPSSSGKTTTAHMIKEGLAKSSINANVVSLDDFYLDNDKQPKLPDGTIDFETVTALDLKKIEHCFEELFKEGKAEFPIFDFCTKKRSDKINEVMLHDDDILIIEGIHALNPTIANGFDKSKFIRLYITVRSEFCDENEEVILHSPNIRLLRRMIRDYYKRNTKIEDTLEMWSSVRAGEYRYIRPFRDTADIKIDSTHEYEPCIYHQYLCPLIETVSPDSVHYLTLQELKTVLDGFGKISKDNIPDASLLHEFVV